MPRLPRLPHLHHLPNTHSFPTLQPCSLLTDRGPTFPRSPRVQERHGLRERSPKHCRKFVPLKELKELMEADTNRRLVKAEHAPMIEEELIAGRLYTGPSKSARTRTVGRR